MWARLAVRAGRMTFFAQDRLSVFDDRENDRLGRARAGRGGGHDELVAAEPEFACGRQGALEAYEVRAGVTGEGQCSGHECALARAGSLEAGGVREAAIPDPAT